ncbi:hypothetical protein BS50DRAFT_292582 [Corynespora cassiicola Philippines]|uniref:Uncharacterized protein n=1 Tax=Corynespora cassiicola Philippines TaxID=1448308 RepID=A0A2T2NWJ0_CORCC|nr:hypothetical protein BS50DRAFT_292582 [Corynespora cassiicola Philippines]
MPMSKDTAASLAMYVAGLFSGLAMAVPSNAPSLWAAVRSLYNTTFLPVFLPLFPLDLE